VSLFTALLPVVVIIECEHPGLNVFDWAAIHKQQKMLKEAIQM
jgi:hypothetical protein